MRYVGIDPGLTGGIACLYEDGRLGLWDIPRAGDEIDLRELYNILYDLTRENHLVCLEDVHAVPGSAAGPTFSFGRVKGLKEGILVGAKASYVLVSPKAWQKISWQGVPLMKKTNGKNDTKGMSFVAAQRLFPNTKFLKSKDGQVDAALMAFYLKTTYGK